MILKDAKDDDRARNRGSIVEIFSHGIEEWRELGAHETRRESLDGDIPLEFGTANRSTDLGSVL